VPGISPEVAVDEVTRPLEEALAATEGVVQVYSQTRGRSVDLFFQPGGDIDQALNDATAAFNRGQYRTIWRLKSRDCSKLTPHSCLYEFGLTSRSLEAVDLRVFADEEPDANSVWCQG